MTHGPLRGIVLSWTVSNLWSPNHEYLKWLSLWLSCKCLNIFFCFLHSTCAFFFFSQMNICNKNIHCVRADVIPLCSSLGNWLINIFIVPLNVVLDFSVKLFQVMKSSWLASLKCLSLFFPWLFYSCPVALQFWACHRNSTLWPLVFRFLCTRNELVYC